VAKSQIKYSRFRTLTALEGKPLISDCCGFRQSVDLSKLKTTGYPGGSHKEAKSIGLVFRFSRDFSLLSQAYGFLSPSPRFLFNNHNHLTKVSGEFWFAVEIFKIHRQVWSFIHPPLSFGKENP
jgi:hypothetical protein